MVLGWRRAVALNDSTSAATSSLLMAGASLVKRAVDGQRANIDGEAVDGVAAVATITTYV